MTICDVLETLYMDAVASGNECMQHDIRIAYHMAKKMNKKLIEYKLGIIETWTEKDVDDRLDYIATNVRRVHEASDKH